MGDAVSTTDKIDLSPLRVLKVSFALAKIWRIKSGCDTRYVQNGYNFWFKFLLGKFFTVNELFLRDKSRLPNCVITF